MKKALALVLAVLMSITFAACSKTGGENDPGNDTSNESASDGQIRDTDIAEEMVFG